MSESIQEELWNIFSYYSLHGNPRDPSRIMATQFYNFCRDALLFDPSMTECALTQAETQLLFMAQIQAIKQASSTLTVAATGRLDYDEFLTCLLRIARKCYPSCASPEAAMQQLLMDNVLPLTSRRKSASECSVTGLMVTYSEQLDQLKKHYQAPLLVLYDYFAVSAASKQDDFSAKSGKGEDKLTFEDRAMEKTGERAKTGKKPKKVVAQLCYEDFIKYCFELGMNSSLGLTTIDIGDIYLTTMSASRKAKSGGGKFDSSFGKLSFDELWQALVRCAFTAFKSRPHVSLVEKTKGMFAYIWRHLQQAKNSLAYGSREAKYRGLIRCFQLLNEKFIQMWTADEFKDYFVVAKVADTIVSPLKRMMVGGASASLLPSPPPAAAAAEKPPTDVDDEGEGGGGEGGAIGAVPSTKVEIEIDDAQDFGDARITPASVTRLLKARPELAVLLKECMLDSGIAEDWT
jgi:hypothetical protein